MRNEYKTYKDKFNKLRRVLIALKEELESENPNDGYANFITKSLKSVGLKEENSFMDKGE